MIVPRRRPAAVPAGVRRAGDAEDVRGVEVGAGAAGGAQRRGAGGGELEARPDLGRGRRRRHRAAHLLGKAQRRRCRCSSASCCSSCAALSPRRLPRDVVAAEAAAAGGEGRAAVRAASVLASAAMMLIRASIGFLTFHLFFWLREDYGLAAVRPGCRRQRAGLDARQRARARAAPLAARGADARRSRWRDRRRRLPGRVHRRARQAIVLAFVVNFSASIGRLAFDSIVQTRRARRQPGSRVRPVRDALPAGLGAGGLPPVAFTLPGWVGFFAWSIGSGWHSIRGAGRRGRCVVAAASTWRRGDRALSELEAGDPQARGVDLGRGGQRLGLPEQLGEPRLARRGRPRRRRTSCRAGPDSLVSCRPSSRSTNTSSGEVSTRRRRTASAMRSASPPMTRTATESTR